MRIFMRLAGCWMMVLSAIWGDQTIYKTIPLNVSAETNRLKNSGFEVSDLQSCPGWNA